jgi:hypothetical protein
MSHNFRFRALAVGAALVAAAFPAACGDSTSSPSSASTSNRNDVDGAVVGTATDAGGVTSGDSDSGAGGNNGGDSGSSMMVDSGGSTIDSGMSAACSGAAPATVTLPKPNGASGTWIAAGGDLTNVPHPSSALGCTTCHLSCGTGAPNTIIAYDHSNPALVCNYCHDPGTKVVATNVTTGSMANYHSSTDSQVCTCCHSQANNAAHSLPPGPVTPIVPSTPACTGTSAWQLVLPTNNAGVFSGGQFFNGM